MKNLTNKILDIESYIVQNTDTDFERIKTHIVVLMKNILSEINIILPRRLYDYEEKLLFGPISSIERRVHDKEILQGEIDRFCGIIKGFILISILLEKKDKDS